MAKKKAAGVKRPPERVPRKERYTAERLRSLVEQLREQSMRAAGLARSMDDSSVKDIQVDGHAMLVRGLNQIDNFTDNCARAVREAKAAHTKL
jgi:hypothetical protein